MKKDVPIPESILSRAEYKKKFSFREMYRALVFVPGAVAWMAKNNKNQWLNKDFVRRLQLAVTEVSGCAACSYQHAAMALQQGMSNEEISSFLSGDGDFVKPEEAKGILFAQHFADARGCPTKDAYDAVVTEYGEKQAKVILSAVQTMLAGNTYGIPLSAFQSRLKGKPFKDSSMFYELGMLTAGFLCLPVALVHGVLRSLLGREHKV